MNGAGAMFGLIGGLGSLAWNEYDKTEEHEERRARERMREAEEDWRNLAGEVPDAEQLTADYEEEQITDDLLLGRPEMADVQTDLRGLAAQRRALQQLQQWGQGGLTATDRAMMDEQRLAEDQYLRGQREAALQNMQARGMGGSGAELGALLSAQQNSSQRMAMHDSQARAQAQRRALAAMQAAGSLGGQMRNQTFGEGAQRASAVDQFNADNTMYRRGVNTRNTDWRNREEDTRREAEDREFQNRMAVTRGKSDQLSRSAGYYGQSAERHRRKEANRAAGLTSAGGGLGGAIGGGGGDRG